MDRGEDREGHGLSGMAERAALVGARLSVGPRPDGGWYNHLVIPTGNNRLPPTPLRLRTPRTPGPLPLPESHLVQSSNIIDTQAFNGSSHRTRGTGKAAGQ